MATTRVIRYEEDGTITWSPSSITTSNATFSSDPYNASGYNFNSIPSSIRTAWTGSGNQRQNALFGLGNIDSGSTLHLTNRVDGTTAFPDSLDGGAEIQVPRYPTTQTITYTFPNLTPSDVLTTHEGIPATRCSARIRTGQPMRGVASYTESVSSQTISFHAKSIFTYRTRKNSQFHRELTNISEERQGGGTDSNIGTVASQDMDLFITGSDAKARTTGTTTNDFTLPANTNDFTATVSSQTGANITLNYHATGTDNSSGGTFHTPINFEGKLSLDNIRVTRAWEGDNIVFDASDSDHTLPTMATAFTMPDVLGGIIRNPGQVSVNTAFTLIAEDTINVKLASTTMASAFTMATTVSFKLGTTKTFNSAFEQLASLAQFRFAAASLQSAFTIATIPTFKPNGATAITSTATLTELNTVKFDVEGDYTWNQFSNNPFIVSGYVKGGYTNDAEYEWNDLTTDTWNNWTYGTWIGDEATWDQWPGNTWNREFVFASVFTMADVDHLHVKFAESALTSAFTLSDTSAFVQNPGAQTLASAFTVSATAQGLIDIPNTTLASAFTLAVSDVDFKDNLEPLTLSSAFTLTATASHKQDTTQTIGSAFNFALAVGNVKSDITDTAPSAFTTDFVAHIKYAPTVPTFNALASTLNVGRLLVQADPYNIITVDAETRTIVIPTENRITAIMEENRLNTIINENRLTKIMQETRTHKLKIPSITDRFSTPRVRSET